MLTVITLLAFGSMLAAMLIAPFVKDDPAMGIKTSYGPGGTEYDHCKSRTPEEDSALSGPALAA